MRPLTANSLKINPTFWTESCPLEKKSSNFQLALCFKGGELWSSRKWQAGVENRYQRIPPSRLFPRTDARHGWEKCQRSYPCRYTESHYTRAFDLIWEIFQLRLHLSNYLGKALFQTSCRRHCHFLFVSHSWVQLGDLFFTEMAWFYIGNFCFAIYQGIFYRTGMNSRFETISKCCPVNENSRRMFFKKWSKENCKKKTEKKLDANKGFFLGFSQIDLSNWDKGDRWHWE